jgi:sugar lactone lactonase YvrE
MKTLRFLFLCFLAIQTALGFADEPSNFRWRVEGFAQPESAVYDGARNQIIVSNIHGSPTDRDGIGYLSRLSVDGSVLNLRWVEGMDAPKGIAVSGHRLFVADIDRMHIVDLRNGAVLETLEVEHAKFLNDVAADTEGRIYVSDMLGHTIYRYDGKRFTPWFQSEALEHPNGLTVQNGFLYIGNWGQGIRGDFSTEARGRLLALELETKELTVMAGGARLANIDGLVVTEHGILISDWLSGNLYHVGFDGSVERSEFRQLGVADIGAGNSLLLLPLMLDGAVEARPIADFIARH